MGLLERVMVQTCYMCEAPGPTSEHVPPKGLFPELKDTLDGRDLRKNLITVPSCALHNTARSKEDQYFLFVLASHFLANPVGVQQAATKQKRQFQYDPALLKHYVPSWEPVTLKDQRGEIHESARAPLNMTLFESAVDKMGRALYFHHFGSRWTAARVDVHSNIAAYMGKDELANNQQLALVHSMSRLMFIGKESHGANPDVFCYNVRTEAGGRRAIRAIFYVDAQIVFLYSPKGRRTIDLIES